MNVRFLTSKIVSIAVALGSFAAIWVWAAAAGRGGLKVEQPPAAPKLTGVQYSDALRVPPTVASQAPASRNVTGGGAVAAPAKRAAVNSRPVTRTRVS
jgi:hypothetical protein